MDFGQLRQHQQQSARQMMYQNSGYQFERRNTKTLILDVSDSDVSPARTALSQATEFSVELFEPLIIDKLSDVYLDSFLTHNSHLCDNSNRMAFSLKINEFNVDSNVASSDSSSSQNMFNRIIIPNEHNNIDDIFSCAIHKGKKMNYICSINPGKISKITGTISDLVGSSMYSNNTSSGVKLHNITLTSGVTEFVPTGAPFTFSGNLADLTTATSMLAGTTDLYFYAPTNFNIGAGSTATIEGSSSLADGLDTLTVTTSTIRNGDHPRFIAEFIIVQRD
jgi:hypothetical protein